MVNLSVRNLNLVEETDDRSPEEIISEIEKLELNSSLSLKKIKEII